MQLVGTTDVLALHTQQVYGCLQEHLASEEEGVGGILLPIEH